MWVSSADGLLPGAQLLKSEADAVGVDGRFHSGTVELHDLVVMEAECRTQEYRHQIFTASS